MSASFPSVSTKNGQTPVVTSAMRALPTALYDVEVRVYGRRYQGAPEHNHKTDAKPNRIDAEDD